MAVTAGSTALTLQPIRQILQGYIPQHLRKMEHITLRRKAASGCFDIQPVTVTVDRCCTPNVTDQTTAILSGEYIYGNSCWSSCGDNLYLVSSELYRDVSGGSVQLVHNPISVEA